MVSQEQTNIVFNRLREYCKTLHLNQMEHQILDILINETANAIQNERNITTELGTVVNAPNAPSSKEQKISSPEKKA